MCLDFSVFMIHGFTVSAKKKPQNIWGSFQLKKGKKNNFMAIQAKKLSFWLAFKFHNCPLDIIVDMST